jgi:hypothetical protein
LQEARSAKPACGRAFEKLLAPLFGARVKCEAPNPAYAIALLADFAEQQSDDVLSEALLLLSTPGTHFRQFNAKPADVEEAVRAARRLVETREAVNKPGPLLWKGTQAFDAAIAKVAEINPSYADSLRCNSVVKRSELQAYGVVQVPA